MARTVLIATKDVESRGGVANYYRLFFQKYHDESLAIERIDIGSRSVDYHRRTRRKLAYALELFRDLQAIHRRLKQDPDIGIVHVNPSLITVPLFRDGLVTMLSKWHHRKVVVFIRGWKEETVAAIDRSRLKRRLFRSVFGRADAVIVLADAFRAPLVRWGIASDRIHVSRTMFDGDLIQPRDENGDSALNFLFLSRLSRPKGAFEIVEAAGILRAKGVPFRVQFHGHAASEADMKALRERVEELGLEEHVDFGDYVDGLDKFQAFAAADVFLLPSHHEGCPNSVLEAMASGCFVISTDVGALKEVVQDGVNGRLVQAKNPEDLAEKMIWTIRHAEMVRRLGHQNAEYAFDHFESQRIIDQIANIYRNLSHAA